MVARELDEFVRLLENPPRLPGKHMVEKAVAEGGRNILGPAEALCQREALTHAQAPGIGETELPCDEGRVVQGDDARID